MGTKVKCINCEIADYVGIHNKEGKSVTLICGRCNSQITIPLKKKKKKTKK